MLLERERERERERKREGGRDGQLFMRRNVHCVQQQLTKIVDSSKYPIGQGVEVRGCCRFREKMFILELFGSDSIPVSPSLLLSELCSGNV